MPRAAAPSSASVIRSPSQRLGIALLSVVAVLGVACSSGEAPSETTNPPAAVGAVDPADDPQPLAPEAPEGAPPAVSESAAPAPGTPSTAAEPRELVRTAPDYASVDRSEFRITPDDATAHDEFGWAVDLDGDTLVVGAPLQDEQGDNAGIAYVFERTTIGWAQAARLLPREGEAGAWFGRDLAIRGDTIVVTAPFTTVDDQVDAGAAYVFVRAGDDWVQEQRLVAADPLADARLGWSMDFDGQTIAVGALNDAQRSGNPRTGAAHLFTRDGDGWRQDARLLADDAHDGDLFGADVAVDGERVVVGAPGSSHGELGAGAAYVFVLGDHGWLQEIRLLAEEPERLAELGWAVALDGVRVVAGAYRADTLAIDAGAAHLFRLVGTTWTAEAVLLPDHADGGEWFGYAVAIDAGRVLVGAPRYTDHVVSVLRQGSAHLFAKDGAGGWEEAVLFSADDVRAAGAGADFGWRIALGGPTAIIGAWLADTPTAGLDSGLVYAYRLPAP